ncbi:MalY/PatB family protein [Tatumella sp. UCD-D_suzukii]|uniref:MalY/PatB family protein n=1 Tax=Tatumella sp. UCD-D_suzukii TaxID=1408192 RepID=UPI00047274DA|nr:PatB family C-S lyase [Tatumella sp. UCD-D_suzukii]
MTFNFRERVDRVHSDSVKWAKYAGKDILPMWIADSDYRTAPCVIEALQQRVAHGIFGYPVAPEKLAEACMAWLASHHQWHVPREWLVFLPGTQCAIEIILRYLSRPDQASLTTSLHYPPFSQFAQRLQRRQSLMPVRKSDQHWQMPLSLTDEKLQGDEKWLFLCNPHNPAGYVYPREELLQLQQFARRHNLLVCSDEVHADLVLTAGKRHQPFAALNEDAAQRSVTLFSPAKAFNIAGLGLSVAIIADPHLRDRFVQATEGLLPPPSVTGIIASEAAWEHGDNWLQAQKDFLRNNRDRLADAVGQIPGLSMITPQATSLAWIDASGLGVDNPALWFEQHGLGFSAGAPFGDPHSVRMNYACAPQTLDLAIGRLAHAAREATA